MITTPVPDPPTPSPAPGSTSPAPGTTLGSSGPAPGTTLGSTSPDPGTAPEEWLPDRLRAVATGVARSFGVEVTPVAASLLGILAGAVGTGVGCRVAGRRQPIGFNVLTLTPGGSPATQGWLQFLLGPLHAFRDSQETHLMRSGEATIRKLHGEIGRDLDASHAGGRPPADLTGLVDHRGILAYRLSPRFLESTFSHDRLRWSLLHCADGGVLVGESRQGLAAALGAAKPSERARLARWIRESWEGEVLLVDPRQGARGSITFVRSLPVTDLEGPALREFLGGPEPLPVLLVPQGGTARQVPLEGSATDLGDLQGQLAGLMNDAFRVRWRGTCWERARLDPGAYGELERFRSTLADHLPGGTSGPIDPRWIDWIPDLAVRIATVAAMFRQDPTATESPLVTPGDLAGVTRWLGGRLVGPHCRALEGIVSPVSAARALERLRLTDTEQRIYHRIQERPGLGRRELLRSLHGIRSPDRDAALTELFRQGLVESDPGGRLFCARGGDQRRREAMS